MLDRSFAVLARALVEEEVPPLSDLAMPTLAAIVDSAKRHISYGLALTREQHRFLRRFAMERGLPASVVVRRLLTLLEGDADVSATLTRMGESQIAIGRRQTPPSPWVLP